MSSRVITVINITRWDPVKKPNKRFTHSLTFEQVTPRCGPEWPVRLNTLNLTYFVILNIGQKSGNLKNVRFLMLLNNVLCLVICTGFTLKK
jgi:hypothetical protein